MLQNLQANFDLSDKTAKFRGVRPVFKVMRLTLASMGMGIVMDMDGDRFGADRDGDGDGNAKWRQEMGMVMEKFKSIIPHHLHPNSCLHPYPLQTNLHPYPLLFPSPSDGNGDGDKSPNRNCANICRSKNIFPILLLTTYNITTELA